MPRSQPHVPAFRALIARALRVALLGASLLSLACSDQEDAPLNPNNFSLEEAGTALDRLDRDAGAVALGLVPNTPQRVRMAADTTRCLAIGEDQTAIGNPVIVANCGVSSKQNLTYTSAREIRTSAMSCIGAIQHSDAPKAGALIAVVPCDGRPASKWTYDAAQRLTNGAGGCYTVSGITLKVAAKATLQKCVSPAPWSQKVLWYTPGASTPSPIPAPPPPNPTIATVKVSPATNTLVKGDSLRLTPTAYNSSGQPVAAAFTWSVPSGASLVSVSQTGWVKGLQTGNATVAASSAGIKGTAGITVTPPSTTPPPTQPPPTQPPPTAPPSGVAPSIPPTLPLTSVNTSWRPPTGKSIAVHAGDNLQNALNSAQRGDEVVIDAGATFTGTFILPAKSGTAANGWITVRTSALSSLPPAGTRITAAAHSAFMPKLVAPSVAEVLRTQPGASGWRIVGIEMTVVPNLTWVHNGLVLLGDGSGNQRQLSQVPSDIILDRVYIHGQPNVSLKRCVALNSAQTAIVDSQLLECHGRGFDSQAIATWNGPGPYRIENNRLEAAGEIIIFGGASPAIQNLVPTDITIRRNYLYRPMSWKGVWTVKNVFELKNAQRVLFEGNVLENNWVDGQVGFAVVLGSFDTSYPWCIVQDVTVRYNHIENSAGAFNLVEHYGNALSMRRVALHHNLMTNIGASGLGTNGRMFQLLDGIDDIWIEHNTGFVPTTYITLSGFTKYKNRFTFRNNIGGGAQYNLHSAEAMGAKALPIHLSNPYVFAGNVIVGSSSLMPLNNSYTPTSLSLGFVNPVPIGGQWGLSLISLFLRVGMGGVTPGIDWTQFVAMTANVRK